jgi:hypothetical protein
MVRTMMNCSAKQVKWPKNALIATTSDGHVYASSSGRLSIIAHYCPVVLLVLLCSGLLHIHICHSHDGGQMVQLVLNI